jgi:hypothetical protein
MIRLVVLFALGLLPVAQAEILSTIPTCNIPADLPPSPEIEAVPADDLHRVELPRIVVEVKQDIPIRGRTFGEALLAQIVVDPDGGSVVLDSEGNLFATSRPACAEQ